MSDHPYFTAPGKPSRPRLVDVVGAAHDTTGRFLIVASIFDTNEGPRIVGHPSAQHFDDVLLAEAPDVVVFPCTGCPGRLQVPRETIEQAVADHRRSTGRRSPARVQGQHAIVAEVTSGGATQGAHVIPIWTYDPKGRRGST